MFEQRMVRVVPNISSSWYIPEKYQTPREKVIYTLWSVGELPYYKILLLTGLGSKSLDKELKELIDKEEVATIVSGKSEECFENTYSSTSFRINKQPITV